MTWCSASISNDLTFFGPALKYQTKNNPIFNLNLVESPTIVVMVPTGGGQHVAPGISQVFGVIMEFGNNKKNMQQQLYSFSLVFLISHLSSFFLQEGEDTCILLWATGLTVSILRSGSWEVQDLTSATFGKEARLKLDGSRCDKTKAR